MFTSAPVETVKSINISQQAEQHIFIRAKHFPGAPTQNEQCTLKDNYLCIQYLLGIPINRRHLVFTIRKLFHSIEKSINFHFVFACDVM